MNRADQLFSEHQAQIHRRTDRMFAVLLFVQFIAGILAAVFISPKTWVGGESFLHIHVWSAVALGGLIVSLPIYLALRYPGETMTRHVIAIAQMLDSALLIHLTGGRIETHFHVFGSLAFLGFYRDWKVLISASVVVALDHFLRGVYWPQSVYGILTPSSWRWLEHTGWVVFEDFFILLATVQSQAEMREIAVRRADLERTAEERASSIAHLEKMEAKLKEAVETRDTFLSVCGHELKTPLTSLKLSTQLVERMVQKDGSEKIQRFVSQTRVQIDRLIRLVDDILDATRLRSNRFSLNRKPVELTQLVQAVMDRCAPLLESAKCEMAFTHNGPIEGQWDPFRLEQVVLNLLTNAIKYGSSKPIEIHASAADGRARLEVKDHGIGISQGDQQRIFQRFERIHKTGSIQGLGLGLFISKGIVEQHGGRITVESELGEGSVFAVELSTEAPGAALAIG
jgi:two-component system, sensor histidine kinase and response regulator